MISDRKNLLIDNNRIGFTMHWQISTSVWSLITKNCVLLNVSIYARILTYFKWTIGKNSNQNIDITILCIARYSRHIVEIFSSVPLCSVQCAILNQFSHQNKRKESCALCTWLCQCTWNFHAHGWTLDAFIHRDARYLTMYNIFIIYNIGALRFSWQKFVQFFVDIDVIVVLIVVDISQSMIHSRVIRFPRWCMR